MQIGVRLLETLLVPPDDFCVESGLVRQGVEDLELCVPRCVDESRDEPLRPEISVRIPLRLLVFLHRRLSLLRVRRRARSTNSLGRIHRKEGENERWRRSGGRLERGPTRRFPPRDRRRGQRTRRSRGGSLDPRRLSRVRRRTRERNRRAFERERRDRAQTYEDEHGSVDFFSSLNATGSHDRPHQRREDHLRSDL